MGFRDRAAGHATLRECDFKQLENLPKPVAFQVRMFQHKKQKIWFVGTRSNLKKWPKDDTPFCEFAPSGSAHFVKLATETAAPFCKALDKLCALAKEAVPGSQFVGYGPSNKIGELSLGLQMATLLGTTVFTFIDDDDPVEAILACVCEPGRVVRARCEKAFVHLLFADGATSVCPVTNQGDIPPNQAVYPEGVTSAPVFDLDLVVERLAQISGVKRGRLPGDYSGWSKQLVSQELNTFVGAEIAEPDTVVPDYARMRLVAQRTAGGKVKLF
jgi:hypothetical protein